MTHDAGRAPDRVRSEPQIFRVLGPALVGFEGLLYAAVGLLLAAAAVLVLVGTVSELVRGIDHGAGGVQTGVSVLDRILLTLIIAELVYTLRLVLRTHALVVEPFLYVGLIAVVRRILIVTAQFERPPNGGRALTNLLYELGLLGLLTFALASAIFLVRRSRHGESEDSADFLADTHSAPA